MGTAVVTLLRPTTDARRVAGAILVLAVSLALAAPIHVVLGAGRLLGATLLLVGVWVTVGRGGVADLSAGAAVAAGALAGAFLPASLDVPVLLGLPLAAVGGAAIGILVAVLHVRLGRLLGALATLGLTVAAPGIVAVAVGGEVGFHAVPLALGGDRQDLVLVAVLVAVALVVTSAVSTDVIGARGAIGLASPTVAAALRRSPVRDAVRLASLGGAITAVAGWVSSVLGGSIVPASYGTTLAALGLLGALLAGRRPAWLPASALVLVGPSILFTLLPVVGDTTPLLTTGPVILVVVFVRARRPGSSADAGSGVDAFVVHPPGGGAAALEAGGLGLPSGAEIGLAIAPGQVVQIRGPNGVGKSTVLAAIAGQRTPPGVTVTVADRPVADGAIARSRSGIARTWQRPPSVDPRDLLIAVGLDPDLTSDVGRAQLHAALATRPRVLLLDEPGPLLREGELDDLVAALRTGGVATLLVEHGEVPGVDRVIELDHGGRPPSDAEVRP